MTKAKKSPAARANKRSRKGGDPVKKAADFLNDIVVSSVGFFGIRPTLEALGIVHATALGTSVETGDITTEELDALIGRLVDGATTTELSGVQVPKSSKVAKSESKEAGIPSSPQIPKRFGFAIAGQCAKPLGKNQYCVRAKHHHEALRCSALEEHADSNIPEEMWDEVEQM